MLVLSSPSGAGKTTLTRRLLDLDPHVSLSISATTRPRRPGEIHGRDYFFVEPQVFNTMIETNELVEYAKVFGHYYGTPSRFVEDHLRAGRDVVFDIDWQGTQQLRQKARHDLVSIFILPPSMRELERRLRTRAQDDPETVQFRMNKAAAEISHWAEYDYIFINHDIDESIQNILSILGAERLKRERQYGLNSFIKNLCDGF